MRYITAFFMGFAGLLQAQPAEFDPADFGKIVIAPRQSAGGGGLTLEQAFGDYQNEPVVNYGENSPAVKLGRPIGRLDMLFEGGQTGFCTAFIVDESHILTNHHCIPGMQGDPTGADSGVQAAQFVAGYINPGRAVGVDRYTVSPQIVETNRNLDYTVLRVFGDPSAKYGVLELAAEDPVDSDFLWIIGHPEGQSQHISREGCAAAAPAISQEGKLVHTCDTLRGNSGSPVLRISDKKVIGLHHAGDSRTGFNQAIPMRRILAQSQVLSASATPTVVAAAPKAVVQAPKPVAAAPDNATREATGDKAMCDALWSEAKGLSCAGYEAYLDSCETHIFRRIAQRYVERNCGDGGALAATAPGNPTDQQPVLTVKQAGVGDYSDLASAIAAAPEGALIEVHPGTYTTGLDVTKPVDIVGIGARDSIVLQVAEDDVIYWTARSGRIANLTIRQAGGNFFGIDFHGGSATLENNDISSQGYAGVAIRASANPLVRNNIIHDGNEGGIFIFDNGRGVIEGNDIYGNTLAGIEVKDASDPTIRGNTLRDGKSSGLFLTVNAKGLVEKNEVFGNALAGIEIKLGATPTLRNNILRNGQSSGLFVNENAGGVIENNEIFENGFAGMTVESGSDPVVRRNVIRDNSEAGIFVTKGGLGTYEDNDIFANTYAGVEIKAGADPLIRRNTIHDGKAGGIFIHEGGKGRIEENLITRSTYAGVQIKDDSDPVVRGNTISDGAQAGVFVNDGGRGVIEGNVISGNAYTGIEVKTGASPTVRKNRFFGNKFEAIWVYEQGGGVFEENDLRGSENGFYDIGEDAGEVTRRGNLE